MKMLQFVMNSVKLDILYGKISDVHTNTYTNGEVYACAGTKFERKKFCLIIINIHSMGLKRAVNNDPLTFSIC